MDKHLPFKSILLPGLIASTLALTGCGSSGGSSSTSLDDTISSRGIITGFGSVYVNGVKYETDDAEFDVDDVISTTQNALRIGQFVTVYGAINANGTTGRASRISYENELQGPIKNKTPDPMDNSIGTMEVLGLQITVNVDTRFDDDLTFNDFNDSDFAEISGFATDTGITATYIEKQDDSNKEIEIVGEIANLTDSGFDIRGFDISYDGNTEFDDDIVLADGLYVEVKGMLDPTDDTVLLAEEIEAEDDGKGDDMNEFEIQGVVANYNAANMTFEIQGLPVDASSAEFEPASLDLGSDPAPEVEVEGYWLDGVLVADEIELKGQKTKINGILTDVGSDTITFTFKGSDIIVRVNQQTEMEDEINETDLALADLSVDDYVEIEAYNDGSGDINAVELDLKEIADAETRIVAALDDFDEAAQTVTLLGITFDLLADGTSYEDADDNSISAANFYAALDVGVLIKLKDDDNDGTFEKAELED